MHFIVSRWLGKDDIGAKKNLPILLATLLVAPGIRSGRSFKLAGGS